MQRPLQPELNAAWHAALHELHPQTLVRDHIALHRLSAGASVIAVGKAAPAMAAGAFEALDHCNIGLVITTDSTPAGNLPADVDVLRASHPIPDERSMIAANAALALARKCSSPQLVVLVSGGASSLLCSPTGLSLEDKRLTTDKLLRNGASIQACNTVRRHLSRVKGGGIAKACARPVHCIILSDVVRGQPHDIGSGPAVADPTTALEAAKIIDTYIDEPLRNRCKTALRETLKPTDEQSARITSAMLASPIDLARAFARKLREHGWDVGSGQLAGVTAAQLSEELVRSASALRPGQGWVVACEPTLSLPANAGHGGRAGWVALHALCSLPDDVVLWAAASDGVDGVSGTGGACVLGKDKHRIERAIVQASLDCCNDAVIHAALGSALHGAPTGSNFTDVYSVLRCGGSLPRLR